MERIGADQHSEDNYDDTDEDAYNHNENDGSTLQQAILHSATSSNRHAMHQLGIVEQSVGYGIAIADKRRIKACGREWRCRSYQHGTIPLFFCSLLAIRNH